MQQDPVLIWLFARERQARFERAAQLERLIAEARRGRNGPGRTDRWLSWLGDLLVEAGLKLRASARHRRNYEKAA